MIRFANAALGTFLGQPPGILLGRPFPYPLERGQAPLEIQLQGEQGMAWAELSVHETQWDGRKASLCLLRDVTERRHTEEALRQSEEKLRQAQKLESIGRLAGGVAHDFNNLLTAINGYSELVLATLEEESPIRLHMEEIRRSGERAAVLTHQLLAYSRKQVLIPKPLYLNQVVEGMANMLRRLIGENIVLETRLDEGLSMVKADLGQLEQAIMNLVVNAKDAMPRGGRILVSTAYESLEAESEALMPLDSEHVVNPGNYAVLCVEDNGVGMDDATKARIFEPFFTTKDVGQGTGLGLSMVYGFVKQSGGSITVASESGSGSAFRIYLPLASASDIDASAHAGKPPRQGRPRRGDHPPGGGRRFGAQLPPQRPAARRLQGPGGRGRPAGHLPGPAIRGSHPPAAHRPDDGQHGRQGAGPAHGRAAPGDARALHVRLRGRGGPAARRDPGRQPLPAETLLPGHLDPQGARDPGRDGNGVSGRHHPFGRDEVRP